jgi:hypothetical protein
MEDRLMHLKEDAFETLNYGSDYGFYSSDVSMIRPSDLYFRRLRFFI